MDAVVTDPAGDVNARDDEGSGLGEPVAELGDDELKLETSTLPLAQRRRCQSMEKRSTGRAGQAILPSQKRPPKRVCKGPV
jgi:hypothetical protein